MIGIYILVFTPHYYEVIIHQVQYVVNSEV